MSASFEDMRAALLNRQAPQPEPADQESGDSFERMRSALQSSYAPQPHAEQGFVKNVGAGFRAGWDNTKALAYGLKAMAGHYLGNEEMFQSGLKGYQTHMTEAANEGVRVEGLHNVKSVDDLIDWAGAEVGGFIPGAAAMTAGAIASAPLGGELAAPGALELIAPTLAKKMAADEMRKLVMKHSVRELVEKGVAEDVAKAAVGKMIKAEVGAAAVGGAVANMPQNTSNLYMQLQQGKDDDKAATYALAGALGMSVLEAAPFVAGAATVAKHALDKELASSFTRAIAKESPKMAAIMGGTGGAEAALGIALHAAKDPNFDWNSSESRTQVLDALGGGAIMGTVMGIATGGLGHYLGKHGEMKAGAAGVKDPVEGELNTAPPAAKHADLAPEPFTPPPPRRPSTAPSASDAELERMAASAPTGDEADSPLPVTTHADLERTTLAGARPGWRMFDANGVELNKRERAPVSEPAQKDAAEGHAYTPSDEDTWHEGDIADNAAAEAGQQVIEGQRVRYIGKRGIAGAEPDGLSGWSATSHLTPESHANGGVPTDMNERLTALRNNNPEAFQKWKDKGWVDDTRDAVPEGADERTIGHYDQGARVTDAGLEHIKKSGWEVPEPESTVDRAARQMNAEHPDYEHVPVRNKKGEWVLSQTAKDAMPPEARYDPKSQTMVPHAEEVRTAFEKSKKAAGGADYSTRDPSLKDNQLDYTMMSDRAQREWDRKAGEFRSKDEAEAQLGPRPDLQPTNEKGRLNAPTITRMGMKLDAAGRQFDQAIQHKRGFELGLSHLETTAIRHEFDEQGHVYGFYPRVDLRREVNISKTGKSQGTTRTVLPGKLRIYDSTHKGTGARVETRWRDVAKSKSFPDTDQITSLGAEWADNQARSGQRERNQNAETRTMQPHGGLQPWESEAKSRANLDRERQLETAGEAINHPDDDANARRAGQNPTGLGTSAEEQGTVGTMSHGPGPRTPGPRETAVSPEASRAAALPHGYNAASAVARAIEDVAKRFGIKGNVTEVQLPGAKALSDLRSIQKAVNFERLVERYGRHTADSVVETVTNHLQAGDKGFYVRVGSDEHFIYVDPKLSATERAVVTSHESGHMVTLQHFDEATREQRTALLAAYNRRKATAIVGKGYQPFHEWLANQFKDWAFATRQPSTAIEHWYQKVATALRQVWEHFRGRADGRISQSFREWMDGVAKRMDYMEQEKNGGVSDIRSAAFQGQGVLADKFWPGLPVEGHAFTPEEMRSKAGEYVKGWIKRSELASDVTALAVELHRKFVGSMDALARTVPGAKEYARLFLHRAGEAGGLNFFSKRVMMRKEAQRLTNKVRSAISDQFGHKFGSKEHVAEEQRFLQFVYSVDDDPALAAHVPPEFQKAWSALNSVKDAFLRNLDTHDVPHGKVADYVIPRALDDTKSKTVGGKQLFIDAAKKHLSMGDAEAASFYNDITADKHLVTDMYLDGIMDEDANNKRSPTADSLRRRKLPAAFWKEIKDLREEDLSTLLFRYNRQIADRINYNDHFGMSRTEYRQLAEKWEDDRDLRKNELMHSVKPEDIMPDGTISDTRMEAIESKLNEELPKPKYNPNHKFEQHLSRMAKEGATKTQIDMIRNLHDRYVGTLANDWSPELKRMSNRLMTYEAARTLPLATLTSMFDLVGPAIRMGNLRQGIEGLARAWRNKEDGEAALRAHGLLVEAMDDTQYMEGAHTDPTQQKLAKFSERFFKWTGMQALDNLTRRAAWETGKLALREHMEGAAKGNKTSLDFLRELGVDSGTVSEWMKNGEKTYGGDGKTMEDAVLMQRAIDKSKNAMAKAALRKQLEPIIKEIQSNYAVHGALNRVIMESKVLNATPGEKPMWANDPRFGPLFMLKGFTYAFQNRVLGRIWHQLNNENAPEHKYGWVGPAIAGAGLMALGIELRKVIQYDVFGRGDEAPTAKMDTGEYLMHIAERVGVFGIAQFAIDAVHASSHGKSAILSFLGPAVDQVESFARDATKGNYARPLAQAIPGLNSLTGLQKNASALGNEMTPDWVKPEPQSTQ